jgi:hypothetical protein
MQDLVSRLLSLEARGPGVTVHKTRFGALVLRESPLEIVEVQEEGPQRYLGLRYSATKPLERVTFCCEWEIVTWIERKFFNE